MARKVCFKLMLILPVITATVECSFSSTKLIKTRLRSRMGEDALECTMCMCIEGPDSLDSKTLEDIMNHYKAVKHLKSLLSTSCITLI